MAVISGLIAAGAMIAGAVEANQQKQKAKGQASAAQNDAAVAQANADAKLKQQHQEDILAQSQAGAVARVKMGGTIDQSGTVLTGDPSRYSPSPGIQPLPPNVHRLLGQTGMRTASVMGSSNYSPAAAPTKMLLGE